MICPLFLFHFVTHTLIPSLLFLRPLTAPRAMSTTTSFHQFLHQIQSMSFYFILGNQSDYFSLPIMTNCMWQFPYTMSEKRSIWESMHFMMVITWTILLKIRGSSIKATKINCSILETESKEIAVFQRERASCEFESDLHSRTFGSIL